MTSFWFSSKPQVRAQALFEGAMMEYLCENRLGSSGQKRAEPGPESVGCGVPGGLRVLRRGTGRRDCCPAHELGRAGFRLRVTQNDFAEGIELFHDAQLAGVAKIDLNLFLAVAALAQGIFQGVRQV